MSATASPSADAPNLTEKQRRILDYLQSNADTQTYFKSRLIGDELDMSAKEVGTNMTALQDSEVGIDVEKWGYSSSTTWMVTA
jgi:biotin operon repressor